MYTLRRITSSGLQVNTSLGEGYNLILKEGNEDDFNRAKEVLMWDMEIPELYGFISHHNGSILTPLYRDSAYFIMTDNGRTFDNLTLK